MSAQTRDVSDQVGSCFGLVMPSHLLESVTGVFLQRALKTVSDISEVRKNRWPV